MSKYKIYDEQILKLVEQGERPCEIAKKIGIDARRVIDRIKANNIKDYKKGNSNELISITSEEQRQVLLGTILGDGCIFKSNKNSNYRMNLAHSLNQEKYFMYKYNVLKNLGFQQPKYESQFDKRTLKTYHYIKTQSLTNPLFTELHQKWYKNGKKIIPEEFIDEIGDLTIAIMFFDDGTKQKRGSYEIAMCDFDIKSINNFRVMLLNRYQIETTIRSRNILYIRANSKEKFYNLVHKYATEDVLYKLGGLLETP